MVAVAPLRRWIRRTQVAHLDRGERLGTFYFVLLFVVIVGGMFANRLRGVFWPATPDASAPAGGSLLVVVFGLLFLTLRRLGPIAISRPSASWLLTAPISRRTLLWPALWMTTLASAAVGGLATLGILAHAGPRPLPFELVLTGALTGVLVLLVARAAQIGRWWGRLLDNVVALLLAAGLAGLVLDSAVGAPLLTAWPSFLTPITAAVGLVAALSFVVAVRRLGDTPDHRLLDAARTAGTVADSAFGVEPSFLVDMVERQYWARRKLRSAALNARLPVLTAQDLRLALRRPRRLLWLAGGTALPALFGHAPAWLLGAAVLAGALLAAGTSTATVRTDAANPVLLRMLALSSRQAVTQRLLVPGVLAAVWAAAALTLLWLLGFLPAGPWWALGLALGPMGAAAAVRRARIGFVDNGLLPLDTPMGSISTGPLLASVAGYDMLLFGLPAVIATATGTPLGWTTVLTQAITSALAIGVYLRYSTSPERVDLAD